MTDKEKKAIELLKQPVDFSLSYYYKRENAIDTILNLIEKQSKEMEEVNKKFIAVDKIKAKIEEVKDGTYDAKIVLQSLLNEEE